MAERESQDIKGVGKPSALEMDTPRIGVRTYLSPNTCGMPPLARLCVERENTLAAQSFEGIDMQTRSYATASIVEAVAYLESYVNEVWQMQPTIARRR